MKKSLAFICFWFTSLLALAQKEDLTRTLAATYYPQPLEQAVKSLIASNIVSVSQQVEYRAGKSILLNPGFEAKAGSIFAAHTEYTAINLGDGHSDHLLIKTYPNPFVEKTTIVYQLASTAVTNLFISDAEGKVVGRLVNNQLQQAGRYEVEWLADQLPTGAYICTLEAGQQHISNRLIRK
ncbi:T9SS type A sorting domain-containing protein [Spirosoma litoris]